MASDHPEQLLILSRTERNFLKVYSKYNHDLFRMALVLCKYSRPNAEDIVQETWVVAVSKIETFRAVSSFKTWLTGILINKVREMTRANERYDKMEILPEAREPHDDPSLNIDLKYAISRLAPGYREILTLHDIMGFKHYEISAMLAINEGTSKSQLHNARLALRQILNEHG